MALYFITYDLRKSRDYQKLYTELKEYNAVRILESTWCFKRDNTSPSRLRDHFKSIIDGDDAIMVSEVTNWASINTDGNPNQLK
ncbi:hypothetical protein AB733_20095 [Photobacterium swingsii]|uniref:Uncharacterized protein n=1 Tax=Photobacterium swingsii TaxID=680026 RepID=A0A0J8V8V5_9GAMM|nr:hypothetical protein [Photobacterium swingsii]KMV29080.1 hypothetical protein AB733_20095 [Photobacterium swingsii]PSW19097.1 hypothetical protein C9I94_23795 [Photobacterium swingsii]